MLNPQAQTNEEQFTLYNQKEIIQILSGLYEQKTTIKVSFNQGKDDYLTHIVEIDVPNNLIYLDMGIDTIFNRRILESPELLILKDNGIRIKWRSQGHSQITLLDGNALRLEIPKQLVRLQRRELFRLLTPITRPVPCEIPVPNAFNPNIKDTLKYSLVDVSLGGIGMIVYKGVHPSIKVGEQFLECKIMFPDVGLTNLTLEVKNIIPLAPENGVAKHRVGMYFVNPSRADQALIHKYTFNLERAMLVEKNARV